VDPEVGPESVDFFFFFFALSSGAALVFDESSSDRSSPGLLAELEPAESSAGWLAADVPDFFLISALLLLWATRNVEVTMPSVPNHFFQFSLTIPRLQKGEFHPGPCSLAQVDPDFTV